MTEQRVRAYWTVSAGLIPGEPMVQKTFFYLSSEHEADEFKRANTHGLRRAEAHALACDLEAAGYNFVNVSYVWL